MEEKMNIKKERYFVGGLKEVNIKDLEEEEEEEWERSGRWWGFFVGGGKEGRESRGETTETGNRGMLWKEGCVEEFGR